MYISFLLVMQSEEEIVAATFGKGGGGSERIWRRGCEREKEGFVRLKEQRVLNPVSILYDNS